MRWLAALALVISTSANAGDYHVLNLEYYDFTAAKFKDNRDPYAPDVKNWGERASTSFRIGLFDNLLYWDNTVHMETLDYGAPKTVGWHWVFGIRVTDQIDLFEEHHSRHIMDEVSSSNQRFPVEDSYGFKIKLIDDPHRSSIAGWFK